MPVMNMQNARRRRRKVDTSSDGLERRGMADEKGTGRRVRLRVHADQNRKEKLLDGCRDMATSNSLSLAIRIDDLAPAEPTH
jgi:hypothetical protein